MAGLDSTPPPAWARALGVVRSLAMYHGVPWRAKQLRRFYARWVPSGGLAFDIGAHAGNRVVAFRRLGARVVALEPQPDFVRLLQWIFRADEGVVLLPQGAGCEEGEARLLSSPRTPTVATLSADWARRAGSSPGFEHVKWQPGPWVKVTTLDALIAMHGMPDFVKIDVEGFELQVLQGLSRPVPALSFEFLRAAPDLALQCIERLELLGRYRYAVSIGERLRLLQPEGMDAGAMRQWLNALPALARSGDVHAWLEPTCGT